MSGEPTRGRTLLNVSIFTVVMVLVAVVLIVVFGEFRFAPESGYHATFTDASRLKSGQDVRISGVPVGLRQRDHTEPGQHRRRRVRHRQALPDVHLHTCGGALREPRGRPLSRDHLGARRTPPARGNTPFQAEHRSLRSISTRYSGGCARCSRVSTARRSTKASNAVMELLQGQGGASSSLVVHHQRLHPEPCGQGSTYR